MTQRPDRVLSIVVTADEYDAVDAFAARYQRPPAEFLRQVVRNLSAAADAFKITPTRSEPHDQ